jgi:hypothetical protein
MNTRSLRFAHLAALLALAAGLGALIPAAPAAAQQSTGWALPQVIPGYDEQNRAANDVNPPVLIADRNRTVHSFNSLWTQTFKDIYYSQWTPDSGWTIPVDILLAPTGQARVLGVFLDDAGIFHLIFFGGDDVRAGIYYSSAPAVLAGQPSAWSSPLLIGQAARAPSLGGIIGDGKGFLAVLYNGNLEGTGVYETRTSDGGANWSRAEVVFQTGDDTLIPWALSLIKDDQQVYHAAWTVVNQGGNGEAIYYAALDSPAQRWRVPVLMARLRAYEVDWPSLVSYDGQLIFVFNDDAPTTRYMRISDNAGRTWTDAARLFPHEGEFGAAAFAVDSNNTLRMYLGNRIGNPAVHGMWQSTWQNDRWSDLEPVTSGPRVISLPGGNGFDPTYPRSVVVNGNTILLVWRTDPGAGPNGLWYTFRRVNAPELPAEPLPTARPALLAGSTRTALQTAQAGGADDAAGPTSTPTAMPPPTETAPETSAASPNAVLLIGTIPAALLLVVVILVARLRRL